MPVHLTTYRCVVQCEYQSLKVNLILLSAAPPFTMNLSPKQPSPNPSSLPPSLPPLYSDRAALNSRPRLPAEKRE